MCVYYDTGLTSLLMMIFPSQTHFAVEVRMFLLTNPKLRRMHFNSETITVLTLMTEVLRPALKDLYSSLVTPKKSFVQMQW